LRRFLARKNDNKLIIDGGEHNHLKNVLRLLEGDKIVCIINDDFDYHCKILKIEKNETICEMIKKEKNPANPKRKVTVFQALTKKDNMHLIVQKLNELGVSNLHPFESEFTTVKDKNNKQDKLQEVSFQSSKQCGRSMSMKVEKTLSFKNMIAILNNFEIVIFANEKEGFNTLHSIYDTICSKDNIALIVGSEGGFSANEICELEKCKNLKSISLGKRILRAETASIAVSTLVLSAVGEI